MILGIGVDSIEISRVVKAMEKEHFVHRIFTEKERAEMEHAKRRGASDFAGKEAVVKAFGTGFAGIDACEVEILRRESGAPESADIASKAVSEEVKLLREVVLFWIEEHLNR